MAEAEPQSGGNIGGWFILFVLIILLVLWLRGGGLQKVTSYRLNFGWQSVSSSTSPFPYTMNFQNLAPRVAAPSGPEGPSGPQGPQ